PDGRHRVRALTGIEQFNEQFGTHYSDDEVDTIGGLVTHRFGRVPHRGEKVRIDDFVFEILRGDARQIHVLRVGRAANANLLAGNSRNHDNDDERD
ncbi:MAG TPA: transporter associated domain-containing protein, partial [Caballeronia sp.]|nr:transporter associated domain-containing protein [Caballeronia sp.]